MSGHEQRATILIVAAPEICHIIRVMLQESGYNHVLEANEDDARVIIAAEVDIGLVITNVPERLLPLLGDTPILYISDSFDPRFISTAPPSIQVLPKPFNVGELVERVRALVPARTRQTRTSVPHLLRRGKPDAA
jgi:DNA-binding response OmpR family regulator